jgi:tRNA dimethylallyltransferase
MPSRAPYNDQAFLGRNRTKVLKKVKGPGTAQILILVGPTGVGKTDVSVHLARQLHGEIVSADSRLIYRMMDIGTAKPDAQVRAAIPHHMIDVADPDQEYTCKQFEKEAREAIGAILGGGMTPIVVGGSGLYVKALVDGIFEGPGKDQALRRKLEAEARLKGRHRLWQKLKEVDPGKAKQVDPENFRRVIRALEVYHLTGVPMSELERQAESIGIRCAKFGLTRERQELYNLVDKRVDRIMDFGFVEEVKRLVENGYGNSHAVGATLGYREMLQHLEGSIPLEEVIRLIKRNTRHFAKRQMTWFRKDREITWIDITGRTDHYHIASEIADLFAG